MTLWGEGRGQLLLDFLSIYTKKRKPLLFSWPRIPFLTGGVGRAAAPVGWGLLWPHNWGGGSGSSSSSNEVPEVPLGTGTPGTSPRGPGGPTCTLLGAVRLDGLCVAPGSPPLLPGKLPTSPHLIPIPLLGRMAENLLQR